jgi:hypothetical protein
MVLLETADLASKSILTYDTEECMRTELAEGMVKGQPAGSQCHGVQRSGPDTYRTGEGLWGTKTYTIAWHATGHHVSTIDMATVVDKTHHREPTLTL